MKLNSIEIYRKQIGVFHATLEDLLLAIDPTFFLEGRSGWVMGIGEIFVFHGASLSNIREASPSNALPKIHSEVERGTPLYLISAPFEPYSPLKISIPEFAITGSDNQDTVAVVAHCRQDSDFNYRRQQALLDSLEQLQIGAMGRLNYSPLVGDLHRLDSIAWSDRFDRAAEAIQNGTIDKVVLSLTTTATKTPAYKKGKAMLRLRKSLPTSHLFATDSYIGASPELLVDLKNSVAISKPLAGTRETQRRGELSSSTKDLREHDIVVQSISAGLLSHTNKVKVLAKELFDAGPISHIATEIQALDLSPELGLLDLLGSIAPTPAIAGYPSDEAIELIKSLEGERGLFGGFVGFMDDMLDGEAYLAIRSVRDLGSDLLFQAGVGIISSSDKDQEFHEIEHKIHAVHHPLHESLALTHE